MAFSASPLFAAASREIQRNARKEFARSEFGRLLTHVQRQAKLRRGSTIGHEVLQRYGRDLDPRRAVRSLLQLPFGTVAGEIQRYSRGGLTKGLMDLLLGQMGPVGTILKSIVDRPAELKGGINQQLQAAANLLKAFGFEVTSPAGATVAGVGRGVEGVIDVLENLGYTVLPPGEEPKIGKRRRGEERAAGAGKGSEEQESTPFPFGISQKTKAGGDRRVVKVPMSSGVNRQFQANHPIVTGDMVRADSHHVYEYGYDIESAFLYVRFCADTQGVSDQKIPGSLYQYAEVTPEMFLAFHEARGSNEWIWDRLRIRGTVSGHQKPYRLVGIMGGYVPRQATLRADGEWFIKRQIKTTSGKWLESQKPEMLVRPLQGEPWTGRPQTPSRGAPNRAAPNRGAP